MQMYQTFRQTVDQYFGPNATLPNVETIVTEHTPAMRSFKVISECPLMRACHKSSTDPDLLLCDA